MAHTPGSLLDPSTSQAQQKDAVPEKVRGCSGVDRAARCERARASLPIPATLETNRYSVRTRLSRPQLPLRACTAGPAPCCGSSWLLAPGGGHSRAETRLSVLQLFQQAPDSRTALHQLREHLLHAAGPQQATYNTLITSYLSGRLSRSALDEQVSVCTEHQPVDTLRR